MVTLNFKKAFNAVTHRAILSALEDPYKQKRMVNFVKSFLCGLTYTRYDWNSTSRMYNNNVGVPQGSVISPILFNVVMRRNEFLQRLPLTNWRIATVYFTIYADDTTLWPESGDYQSTERACEELQDPLLIA